MPNRAIITVTTADSKYSRKTDFGGPFGFVSISVDASCPLRLKTLENVDVFGSAFVSETVVVFDPLEGLLIIFKSS